MKRSLRNKIKRGACIACASLSLGGLNASKSNAMNGTGTTLLISGSSIGGVFLLGTLVKKIYTKHRNERMYSTRGYLLFYLAELETLTDKEKKDKDIISRILTNIILKLEPKQPDNTTENDQLKEDKNSTQIQDEKEKEFLEEMKKLKEINSTDPEEVNNVREKIIIALSTYLNINEHNLKEYLLKNKNKYMYINGYSTLKMKMLGLLQK